MSCHPLTATALTALLFSAGCQRSGETDEPPAATDAPLASADSDSRGLEAAALAEPAPARTWQDIKASGMLRVGLPVNSTSYFQYRGTVLGMELQALDEFATAHDLELHVQARPTVQSRLDALRYGQLDLVGGRLAESSVRGPLYTASEAIFEQTPTTVQTEPSDDYWVQPCPDARPPFSGEASCVVTRPEHLAGRQVFVTKDSPWVDVLEEIETEDGDIIVVEIERPTSTEAIIRAVSAGDADLAVAGDDLARLVASHYGNLRVAPRLGEPEPMVFAGRAESPELMRRLDAWISSHDTRLQQLHERYFKDRQGYQERIDPTPLEGPTDRISDYDALFKKHAPIVGYDWRLIAAQTYQESRFKPRARSWAGARGLMQLMPRTGQELGVRNPWDPDENVKGGVTYLKWMDKAWRDEITDPDERVKFVLASYNAGRGHVLDAQRLAKRAGADPTQWAEVAPWMLQLSRREVYRDPIVRHGFCRGLEPVLYVAHILRRYEHFKQLVNEEPLAGADDAQGG